MESYTDCPHSTHSITAYRHLASHDTRPQGSNVSKQWPLHMSVSRASTRYTLTLHGTPTDQARKAVRAVRHTGLRRSHSACKGEDAKPTKQHARIPIANCPQSIDILCLCGDEYRRLSVVDVMACAPWLILRFSDGHCRAVEP